MELFVIRNTRQLLDLTEMLKKRRLPLKIAVDDIYPKRSLDMNAYYFGVVLKYIGDETGHSVDELHEHYKKKFCLQIEFEINKETGYYEPVFGVGSTTRKNQQEFFEYVYKVRADGELTCHVVIPYPNEDFVPALDYSHDKIEQHKI